MRRLGPLLITLVLGAVLSGAVAVAEELDGPMAAWRTAAIDLPNRGMVHEPVRDQLLVTVDTAVPGLGNQLVELDPRTGALGRRLALAGQPSELAVSDDGSRAYVGFVGASEVAEVDLADFTLVRRFDLGRDTSSGSRFADDLEVPPGQPEVLVASRRNVGLSPRHEGVAVYEQGVPRPEDTPDHTGADDIELAEDPSVVYGLNDDSSRASFYVHEIDDEGIHRTETHDDLFSSSSDEIEVADGRATTDSGQVVDLATRTFVGTFPASGAFEVVPAIDTTFFLRQGTLRGFDTASMEPTGQLPVALDGARDLVATSSGLAAATADQVVLIGPDVTGADFGPPPAQPQHLLGDLGRTIDLAAADIVAGAAGDRLYAVTTSSDEMPEELVEIDPADGSRSRHVPLGAEPRQVELSDDGTRLLVSHVGEPKVTEVDVASMSVVRSVTLPSIPGDVSPAPGDADRYAVILAGKCCRNQAGSVGLVDDGALLPNVTDRLEDPTAIEFGGEDGRLYGYAGNTTGYYLHTFEVEDDGVTAVARQRRFLNGFWLDLFQGSDGEILVSNGAVVDPDVPTIVGRFAQSGIPVAAPSWDRLLSVAGSTVHESDLGSQALLGSAQGVLPESAIAAVSLGPDLLAAAGASTLTFLPIGDAPPGAPTGLEATVTSGSVTLQWGAPVDGGVAPGTYRIRRDGVVVATVDADTTTWTDDGLSNGTPYTYAVSAVNDVGEGPPSASVEVTPAAVPTAPRALTGRPGDGQVTLTWAAPVDDGGSPVLGYRVHRDGAFVHETGSDDLTWTDPDASNGVEHAYEVRARNAQGTGAPSATVRVTPYAPQAPGPPRSLQAIAIGSAAELTWRAPVEHGTAAVSSYLVHRDGDVVHELDVSASVGWPGAIEVIWVDEDVSPWVPHRYAVQARSADGDGPLSAPATITVPGSDGPFADVPADHPFAADVGWAAGTGITTGYADGTFRPGAHVTRQAMAAFLFRLAGSPEVAMPPAPTFADVGPLHPFLREIEWAAGTGVATGFAGSPKPDYRPDEVVTRQAMAAFLFRLHHPAARTGASAPAPAGSAPTFVDVGPGHPFAVEIAWMSAAGITSGYGDGTFRPGGPVTRQAMAAFLHRSGPPVDGD